jgi:hypothetical protein
MPSETGEICATAIAELAERDPELYKALRHVIFWDNTASCDLSLADWKRQALNRADRLAMIRATMRPREFR